MDKTGNSWDRLIIIGGMARTGTSALASFVGSHPDVKIVVSERFWFLAENELVRVESGPPDWLVIKNLLAMYPDKRILIKQPWVSLNLSFLLDVMSRGGKVLICFREMQSLFESWEKTQYVSQYTKSHPKMVYENRLFYDLEAVRFGAMRIDQEKMSPDLAIPISDYLGLDQEAFDIERIQKRWGLKQEEKWIREHGVWQERMLWLIGKDNKEGG